MQIPYTKTTLANGLDVIVHEDHQLPMVAVNLWYHVGSKNERPGRTGFAHLFEHLMFEGSQHYDHGYFQPLQQAGASLNGSTNADRTNYWEVVPSNALELALWMESDRMGYLLPALTDAKFDNQRDVVMLQDFVSTPQLRETLSGKDGKAWILPIGLAGELGTPEAYGAFERVSDIVDRTVAGTDLKANLTGPASTVADLTAAGAADRLPIELAIAILLLIFVELCLALYGHLSP